MFTYDETMALLEDFMQRSGVAHFCREVCKGNCCGSCYKSKQACHKHEGRRLACTAFICGKLFDRVGIEYGTQPRSHFLTSKSAIELAVRPFLMKTRWVSIDLLNAYFDVPDIERMKKRFKIEKHKVTCFFNEENVAVIYEKMQMFKDMAKKVDTFA